MNDKSPNLRAKQAGNALFLILIAVALFAALAYAVTQSGKGGSSGVGRETATLDASRIVQSATMIQQVAQRMFLGGCTETTINFYNGQAGMTANFNAPADGSCDVFGPNGGGLSAEAPPPGAVSAGAYAGYMVTSRAAVAGFGTGTAASDILVSLIVSRDQCIALNNMMGVTNPSGEPPDENIGPYSFGSDISSMWPNAGANSFPIDAVLGDEAMPPGLPTACFHDVFNDKYEFYHLVLER